MSFGDSEEILHPCMIPMELPLLAICSNVLTTHLGEMPRHHEQVATEFVATVARGGLGGVTR